MMNQGRFLIISMCAVAALLTANGQENESVEKKDMVTTMDVAAGIPETKFANLVRVVNILGVCDVKNPDIGRFKSMQYNQAYPMGSVFRTAAKSTCVLIFSSEDSAVIGENSELIITACKDNSQKLTVKIVTGEIKTTLRDNLADGSFAITTANAEVKNMAGRGIYTISMENGNEMFKAATITGTSRIEGPHYTIPSLQAANKVNITTSENRSFSRLTSISGDFAIELLNGNEEPLIYQMSPKAVIKIWRENAPVGGRTIVSTLVVSPKGIARHRFAYAEGRQMLKTGELVEQTYEDIVDNLPVLLSEKEEESTKEDDSAL